MGRPTQTIDRAPPCCILRRPFHHNHVGTNTIQFAQAGIEMMRIAVRCGRQSALRHQTRNTQLSIMHQATRLPPAINAFSFAFNSSDVISTTGVRGA